MSHFSALFIVDEKHRDFRATSLIGYFLQRRNVEVYFAALSSARKLAEQLLPDVIIVPKPWNYHTYLSPKVIKASKIIVLQTEGNPQSTINDPTVTRPVDAYFFWNSVEYSQAKDDPGLDGAVTKVIGNPRLDFFHTKLSCVNKSRKQLEAEYNLDSTKPTITITTRLVLQNLPPATLASVAKGQDKEMFGALLDQDNAQAAIVKAVIDYLYSNSIPINIVAKPHPNEHLAFWESIRNRCPRIKLVVGDPIENVLTISDFNISNVSCTTTGEALIAGVKSSEISTESDCFLREDERRLPQYRIKSSADMANVVEYLLSKDDTRLNDLINPQRIDTEEYIQKYYHRFDGECCQTYADEIYAVVRNVFQINRYDFSDKLRSRLRNLPLSTVKMRRRLYTIYCQIRSLFPGKVLIDARGRYDHRIRTGDAERLHRHYRTSGI